MGPPAHQTRNVKASGVSLVNKKATRSTTSSRKVLEPGKKDGERERVGSRIKNGGERLEHVAVLGEQYDFCSDGAKWLLQFHTCNLLINNT